MIELRNTSKKFGIYTALDHADLKIEKGTAFGLLGSNGAGKSTVLRLLSGIYKPDGGDVLLDGEKVYNSAAVKQKVFFINDETVQFGSFTLNGLKKYYRSYYPNFSEDVFSDLNGKVKLPLDKRIDTFSKGMKRQAIVIVGLACQTEYLLLDEAFDGLDPTMRLIVKKMLVDAMLDRQLTAVISSHNLREINEICDTAALLHNGKIVFAHDLDSITSSVHKLQIVLPRNEDGSVKELTADDLKALGLDILHFEKSMSVLHVIARGEENDIRRTIQTLNPMLLEVLPQSLEEIFIYEMEALGYDSSDIK